MIAAPHEADWITFGPYTLFPRERRLQCDGKDIRIGGKALDLLVTLIARPGEFHSKADLAEQVWHREWVEDITVRVAVSNLRKVLGAPTAGGDFIINIVGRGYSFSNSIPLKVSPHTDPDTSAGDARAGRLPALLNEVIGRQDEIRQIVDFLEGGRIITIAGPAGIGKTTVAISAAFIRADAGRNVCFVDFASVRDGDLVPNRIAHALGYSHAADDAEHYILRGLSGDTILLFDNCEHLVDAIADTAEAILRQHSGVQILATSREPLRIEGETVFRLLPLDYPVEDEPIDAQRALTFPAVQFLVERVKAASFNFILVDEIAPAAASICRRLDGLALAIQLAASHVQALGILGVTAVLGDRFRLLGTGIRTALPRHQTLEAAFEWSYDLLSQEERNVFERISVFPSSFDLAAACDVAGWDPVDPQAVPSIIASLVDKSLLTFSEELSSFRFLESIHAFAKERLSTNGDSTKMAARFAEYVISQCESFQARSRDGIHQAYASSLLDNIRSALESRLSQSDRSNGIKLARAAVPILIELDSVFEFEQLIQQTLNSSAAPRDQLTLRLALGSAFHLSQGNWAQQVQGYEKAHELALDVGDIDSALQSLWGLMAIAWSTNAPAHALQAAERFYSLASAQARQLDALVGNRMIASSLYSLGRYQAAERHLKIMLDGYPRRPRTTDFHKYMFNQRTIALTFQAPIQWITGRADSASDTAARAVSEAGDHLPSLFISLAHCACPIAIDRGDWAYAERLVQLLQDRCGHRPAWRSWVRALMAIISIHRDRSASRLSDLEFLSSESAETLPRQYLWYRLKLIRGLIELDSRSLAGALLKPIAFGAQERQEFGCLPEVLRLKAILIARTSISEAEAYFSEALELASASGAKLLELGIAVDFHTYAASSSSGKTIRQRIARILAKLNEQSDVSIVREARRIVT